VLPAAAATLAVWTALSRRPALERRNYRDRPVSLAGGPALVAGAAAGAAAAGGDPRLVALLALTGGAGLVDDLRGGGQARGLGGHFAALRDGVVTTGALKLAAVGAAAVALVDRPGGAGRQLPAALLVAGSANLANLLDLRPGRALKAVGAAGAALAAATPGEPGALALLTATAVVAVPDLAERAMIGDCGANAAGAAVGWLAARRASPPWRTALAATVVGLNLASERVSFSAVIDRQPLLRALDRAGRRG
jgi:hypothetical protein